MRDAARDLGRVGGRSTLCVLLSNPPSVATVFCKNVTEISNKLIDIHIIGNKYAYFVIAVFCLIFKTYLDVKTYDPFCFDLVVLFHFY